MFEKSATARHKNEHRVIVALTGQPPFAAYVFLKVGERLIDLLNDQRQFIPIKRADGATMIASKQNIVSIIEQPEEEPQEAPAPDPKAASPEQTADPAADPGGPDAGGPSEKAGSRPNEAAPEDDGASARKRRRFDPYEILRISKDAGPEEIRRAYHARMKQVHPDAIASLDLGEDLERAANITARRLNRAYEMLMREKAQAPAEETAA